MSKSGGPSQLHIHFIRSTPQSVWEAITDGAKTPQYFHGCRVESDFEDGAPIRYIAGEGDDARVILTGEVVEVDSGRRLVHTFQFADKHDPPTRVAYDLEEMGEITRLTVVHDGFETETETFETTLTGWPPIFSGLKTLLETGTPLGIPAPAEANHG